ncbi:MAG: 16S rRNA (uracil(1498)-N(3))-methyltransferase [Prevotella sp.]|nr:16S rRNA (uracil(1498)-N(3))-methyltransferase [Prevotella sp.]
MKEVRFFYVPDVEPAGELPSQEAGHALRVLRLSAGDEMMLMDGCGMFYRAEVASVASHRCYYKVVEELPQQRLWRGHLHLAVAPTKTMERMEWLAEKATEIGFDEMSLVDCQFSERHVVKTERLEKIVISAVKQSRKAWKPQLNGVTPLRQFISSSGGGRKYIAHCHNQIPRLSLFAELQKPSASADATVLIGPEGDFSIDEVRQAMDAGFESVDLGPSRLRTETAALSAVMMMQLCAVEKTLKKR